MEQTLLIITTVFVTLLAGIFLAYAISVNGALHKLADREYIRAMQQVNIVIQNGLFFLIFMGPVLLLPITTYLLHDYKEPVVFYLLIGASAIYIIGSFILTVAGNVPYNERLANIHTERLGEIELSKARNAYETPWNTMHAIRTVASVVAGAMLVVACALV